ncbi:uncharacterized protein CLUP02_04749 [Colletotrichum lupini]|uniref:Uncharacterized protein n=1 Tax=Colletotrichum lupini TaxID=145971 RepID=A0A9Q8SLS8_9PEZI|nr:uncharacterized protein CLUP02_04749 [Colletotrichum lupini]UQC79270.1 hypothetical protein CLUP02_04749 [Colletotrichum lupini]
MTPPKATYLRRTLDLESSTEGVNSYGVLKWLLVLRRRLMSWPLDCPSVMRLEQTTLRAEANQETAYLIRMLEARCLCRQAIWPVPTDTLWSSEWGYVRGICLVLVKAQEAELRSQELDPVETAMHNLEATAAPLPIFEYVNAALRSKLRQTTLDTEKSLRSHGSVYAQEVFGGISLSPLPLDLDQPDGSREGQKWFNEVDVAATVACCAVRAAACERHLPADSQRLQGNSNQSTRPWQQWAGTQGRRFPHLETPPKRETFNMEKEARRKKFGRQTATARRGDWGSHIIFGIPSPYNLEKDLETNTNFVENHQPIETFNPFCFPTKFKQAFTVQSPH